MLLLFCCCSSLCVCGCVNVWGTHVGKRHWIPIDIDLQEVVSFLGGS